jgi:hypothetical protein
VFQLAHNLAIQNFGASGQPIGTGVQKYLLEPETAGQFECGMNLRLQNVRRLVAAGQNPSAEPLATTAANTILSW